MFTKKDFNDKGIYRKRSIAELDDVIEEILQRNPDFVAKLDKVIEDQLSGKTPVRKVPHFRFR